MKKGGVTAHSMPRPWWLIFGVFGYWGWGGGDACMSPLQACFTSLASLPTPFLLFLLFSPSLVVCLFKSAYKSRPVALFLACSNACGCCCGERRFAVVKSCYDWTFRVQLGETFGLSLVLF